MEKTSIRPEGSRPELEALEDQVLYSADALGGLDAVLVADRDDTVLEASLLPTVSATNDTDAHNAAVSAEHADSARHEVVFVDTDTPSYQQLVDDLQEQSDEGRRFDIFVLDNSRDGIAQISEVLAGYDSLDAVHIISHGTDGSIDLGGSRLDADALNSSAGEIGSWANAFAETGDILIYGCNLAETEAGQSLISELSSLTLADVAASTDKTGHESLGGDWELEHQTGTIEASVAPSAELQARYEQILAVINGTAGDDVLAGTAGDDVISGDAGNDVLVGGGGSDQLLGEAGADVFRFTGAQEGDAYTVDGGSESDTIDLSEFGSGTVSDDGSTITVDLGDGKSFAINYTNIESIITADTAGNHGPDANAGPDQPHVMENIGVDLDGTRSDDFDGDALTYQWTQVGGPVVTLNNPNTAQPSFTSPNVATATTLTFQLVVSDGTNSHIDTTEVTVLPTITGGFGGDNLTGTAGDDFILGLSGADTLDGGDGNDVLAGGIGNDALIGGSGTDIANYSDSFGGVSVDITLAGAQNTGGGGTDTLSSIEGVIGSTSSDTFTFSNPQDGAVYSVDGNTGTNTLDLSAFASTDVTFGDGTLTVDMGSGQSFSIEYARVNLITFSDTTATVLTGDASQAGFSGSGLWIDGAEAFRIDVTGGGTVDLAYDRGSDTLSVTGTAGTSASTALVIEDLNGNDLRIDQVAISTDIGSITSDANIGTINVLGDVGVITVAGGTGSIGELNFGIKPSSDITVNADVASIQFGTGGAGDDLATSVTVNGDLGALLLHHLQSGGAVVVSGDAGTIDVTSDLTGSLAVAGDVTTFDMVGEIKFGALVDLAGDVGTLTADRVRSDITIGGDLDSATFTSVDTGVVVSAQQVVGTLVFDVGGTDFGGTYAAPTVYIFDGDTQTASTALTSSAQTLWMTTEEDVASPSGANGLDSWSGGSVLALEDPNLAFGAGTTDGTLSNALNLDLFVQDGDSRLDAVHYVGTSMTVGSNAVPLQAGDILLSSVFSETLVNSDTSTLAVTSRDVFVFRPDDTSNYALGGTFIKLINGQDLGIEIEGITLVEQSTTVGTGGGATTLDPGDFLFTDRDNDSVIFRLQPGVLGDSAFNTGTVTTLVDGTDLGINQTIHGVELVESNVAIGDRILTSGQLLISLYADDVVAGTSVSAADIFILDVTDTGTATTATAEALFAGGDVGFDTWQESPWAVSLVPVANEAPIANADNSYLVFDGNDIVRIANDPALQVTSTLTMEARFNLNVSATGSQMILNKEGEYEVGINADTGELRFAIAQSDNTWAWHNTGYFVTPGDWTHVAVTYDGVAGEAHTYVNGELVETLVQSGNVGDAYPGFNDLTIGGRENDADERFLGQIDDVRVWNTARSGAEINANYNDVLSGSESGLAGYWRLDGVVGTQVSDLTANNNDGVLGGAEGAASAPVYDGYSTDQNSTLVVAAGQGVLANDTDQDGDTLSITNLDASGLLGNLVMNTADGSFTYDPNGAFDHLREGEVAYDTFSYSASDGTTDSNIVTVTIAITGTEDAPTAASNTVTTNEDTAYTFSAADFNFSDADAGDTLQHVQITSLPANGTLTLSGTAVTVNQVIDIADIDAGNLVFSPAANDNGVGYASFDFRVSDGNAAGTAGTVLHSFPAPAVNSMSGVAHDGTNIWLGAQNANTIYQLDTDGNVLNSFAAPGPSPTGIAFDGTNLWIISRDNNMVYEVDISGNVLSSFATPGTDSRGLTWDGNNLWLVEGNGSLIYELTTTGSVVSSFGWPSDYMRDITWDGSSLWVSDQNDQVVRQLNTSGTELSSFASPSTGAAGLAFDGTDFWHADADTDQIYQIASQASLVYSSSAYTMSIDVDAVDDAAVITGNTSYTGDEGDVVAGDLDATDVEGLTDTTYFTVSTPATNGTATIDPETGAWSFTPTDPNWFGTDSFEVTVTDDLGGMTTQLVSITLANVDDAAVITGNTSYTGDEGDVVAGDLDATDVEGLTDTTYFTVSTPATNGTATIDPETGAWSFTPTDPNWFGTDSFEVTVTDDLGGMTTQLVSITLANVDDAAVITGNTSYTGDEGDVVAGDLDATDVEGLTDTTYFTVSTPATNGTAVIDPETGAWSFTPTDPNWFGTDSFEVTVTDDLGGTTTQVVNVTLASQNDSPTDLVTTNTTAGGVSLNEDGGNDVYYVADNGGGLLGGLTTITLEVSFSITTPGADNTPLLSYADGTNDEELALFLKNDGRIWFCAHSQGAPFQSTTGAYAQLFDGEQHQVSVSWDSSNGAVDFYIDGVLVESFTGYQVGQTITGDGELVFGQDQDSELGGFNTIDVFSGVLYDVRIFDGVRTAGEVSSGHGQTLPSTEPGMIANWTFSDRSAGGVVTESVSGNNLTEQRVTGAGFTASVSELTLAVPENALDGTVVGELATIDPDSGDTFSYTLLDDAGGRFDINGGTGVITVENGSLLDFEAASSHDITVRVTDAGGLSYDEVFTISVTNADDLATIGGDTSGSANEGVTVTGTLSATDPDGLTDTTYFTVSAPATNGTANIDAETGAWSFTPTDPNWFGTDSFEVTVTDDLGGTTTQLISITLANVDDAAVITGNTSYTGDEGDVVAGDLDATDVEGLTDATYFTVSTPATSGTANIDAETGAWTFTPTDPNWFGTDSFEVTVTDDLGGTTTQLISITLANVDDAAVITGNTSYTGDEGDVVAGDLDATDVDGLADSTYFTVSTPATNGTANIDAETGAWTFTPTDPNWFGTDSFEVTVTDDLGGTTTQLISITLANVDDAAVITGNTSYTGDEGDVVAGDLDATDVDGLTDTTYFTVSTPATNGTANIDAETGAWTFTPTDPNWFGTDSFEVTVTDDLGGTTTQLISITLANVDDAAVITGNTSYTGDEGDVVAGDLDATDVDGLTDTTYFTVSTPATNGTANIDAETGAWTFTPTDPNWFGTDSFEVTVTDDLGGTTTQLISITLANVDDAAVITGNTSFSGNEGDVVAGDLDATDVDGLTDSTYFTVSAPATNGTAAIDPETGAWSFTPTDPNWFGTDSFEVTVTDDLGGTTTQLISITLANVDDAAVITGNTSYTGDEGDVVAGDLDATDVEGLTDSTYFTVSTPAANGTAAVDPETGAWSFTPTDPNWFGTDSFEVTVTDDLGGTTTQLISITLANVDDAAVITGNTSYTGDEGDVVAGDLDATDVEGLTDATYFTVSTPAANGAAVIDSDTGAWSFTPTDPNWFGTDSFEVTVTDDLGGTTTQLISVTLANVDDAAVITGNTSYTGDEDDVVAGDLDATDVDGLTDTTYFTVTTPATNGTANIDAETGAWTFTPTDPNWFGTDSFEVTVTDDLGGTTTQLISITLANADDAAVITGNTSYTGDEGDAVAGDLDATDVEGLTDSTYFTVSTPATNGTANIDAETGAWTFTPTDPNWFGTDSFEVTVTDDLGGTTTQLISITLANVDDGAVITGNTSYTGDEGDVVAGDLDATDVEGLTDATYFTVTTPATNGTANIDAETGAWTFTPTDPNWFGTDSFEVTVTDDLGGTTTQLISITLANVDDAAVITGNTSYTGDEGDVVAGDLDATDVEGLTDATYFTVSTPATNGTANIDAETGAWSFTPTDPNWFGTDSFEVTVTDDLGGTTTQLISITLANVDDGAVITGNTSYTGDEGDVVAGDLDATDVEGLTDATYFTVTTPATNGTANIDAETGAWSFTPTDPNWFGTDSFEVMVTDDLGGTTTQLISITLANVDDAAVITGNTSYTGDEGDAVAGDLDATDVEGLTDATYFTVSTPAANGAAVIDSETGAWSFTPTDPNWFGTDSFEVTVTDDLGGTTTQLISVTLANVDDAAVITGNTSYTGDEGDVVAGDLDATDVEGLTDSTYFTVSTPAANGTAAVDPETGAWSFTPTDPNWFGTDSFEVTVTDDLGGTTTQLISITLANVDDGAVITGNTSYTGDEGDVVAGDLDATDVEGLTDATYFTVSTPATSGTANIDAETGAWTFTPTDPNWFGTDSFEVTVTDDLGGTTTQLISITLANVDDAAVITGNTSYTGDEGDAVAGDLDATDVDGLTDTNYFTVTTPATNGTANIDAETGAWTFTPTDPNWFGTDSFEVTVTDDLGSTTTQLISITLANVDDAAVITGNTSYTGDEGDVVAGDLDATDVDGLTDTNYFTVTTPATNGTANIDAETGAWTFTPTDPNWFGTDSFEVTVTDDLGGTTTQLISITLANVDDAAVITGNTSYTGDEGDVVAGDLDATDVEGLTDSTYFTVTTPAANGTAAIDPETGAWSFTPTDPNWFGTDSFEVTVTDDLVGTTTQLISITLANVDDAAVITGNTSYTGDEGDVVAGDLDATDVDGLTDATYFMVSTPATNGTANIDAETGAWSFTPTDPNWFGTDSFEVTVTDDLGSTTTQLISITLANVDDAAVITGDTSFSGNEGDSVAGGLDATDVEGLTDATYFTVSTPATSGTANIDAETGAWTFTPTDSNWSGSDRFVVTVTDDLGGTTRQVVNITAVNVDEAVVIGGTDRGAITEDANVVDGSLLAAGSLTAQNAPDNEPAFQAASVAGRFGTLNTDASGNWTYVADNNAAAIQALDAGETVVENLAVTTANGTAHEISVTINGSEDAPVITASPASVMVVGNTVSSQGILTIQDPDAADNPVAFRDIGPTLSDNGYGQFQMRAGTWTFALDSGSAAVQLLQPGQTLVDSFEFVASDGSTKLVTVTIFGAPDNGLASGAPAEVQGQDENPDDFAWLNDIMAVAANSAEPGEASIEAGDEASVEEAGETSGEGDVNPNLLLPPSLSVETPVLFATGETESVTQPERRDGSRAAFDLEDLMPLIVQQEAAESEQDSGVESPAETPVSEKQANTDALRKAMDTMREEIKEAAEDSRSTSQMVEMGLRVSGTALSTGSLAWLLRSASLFASALSSVPTWKSFDPLPVLARKKHDKTAAENPDEAIPQEDESEAAVGRILDGAGESDRRKADATTKRSSQ